MGIFGALTTAVTGMRAQSFALENISGNIANSQTTAFKRVDTSFEDLIPDNIPSKQLAGNVIANSRSTNNVQGDIQNAAVGTYMAINGQGFFVVEKPSSFADNRPVFDGVDLYTRRGDFQTDKNGYLVNGAGYYLMGIPVDANTGNLVGSVPQLLQFDNGFLPAQATTQIDYKANLASYPLTPAHDTNVPRSELLSPANFSANPVAAHRRRPRSWVWTRCCRRTISPPDGNGGYLRADVGWRNAGDQRHQHHDQSRRRCHRGPGGDQRRGRRRDRHPEPDQPPGADERQRGYQRRHWRRHLAGTSDRNRCRGRHHQCHQSSDPGRGGARSDAANHRGGQSSSGCHFRNRSGTGLHPGRSIDRADRPHGRHGQRRYHQRQPHRDGGQPDRHDRHRRRCDSLGLRHSHSIRLAVERHRGRQRSDHVRQRNDRRRRDHRL